MYNSVIRRGLDGLCPVINKETSQSPRGGKKKKLQLAGHILQNTLFAKCVILAYFKNGISIAKNITLQRNYKDMTIAVFWGNVCKVMSDFLILGFWHSGPGCMSQHQVSHGTKKGRGVPKDTAWTQLSPSRPYWQGSVGTRELGPLETDCGEELGCLNPYSSGQPAPPQPLKTKSKDLYSPS